MNAEQLGLVFLHAGYQLVVGVGVGTALDYIFGHLIPQTKPGSTSDSFLLALEVFGQIVASSVFAGMIFQQLIDAPTGRADPASGLAFSMAITLSQPMLQNKIIHLMRWFRLMAGLDEEVAAHNIASPSGGPVQQKSTSMGEKARVGTTRDVANA